MEGKHFEIAYMIGESCDCEKEEPPRCTGTAPKVNLHNHDTMPRPRTQEQAAQAWKEWDAC